MKIKRYKSGFTLLEVVIYLAFFGLFSISLSSTLHFFISQSNYTSALIFWDLERQFLIQKMTYEIQHADSIMYPSTTTSSSLTFMSGDDHIQKTFLIGSSSVPELLYADGRAFPLTDSSDKLTNLLFDFSSTSSITLSFNFENQTSTVVILKNI